MSVASRLRLWVAGLRRDGKRHLGSLALFAGVLLAVQLWQIRGVAGGPLPDVALDAPLPVLTGGGLRQSSLRAEIAALQRAHPGQNIGLYVWADWCPICKTIQGTVNGLTQDHPVITVAMQSGPPEKVARYMASRGLAWHTVVDPQSLIPGALGFGAVPAFAVITPEGELRWPTVGLSSGWGLRARLWLAH
ncbi:protein disulfide oxidoreductase [Hydrogenophaga sp.]|uniref:protein disulfide oxidoreductase n=1 Tax=Hydrogenophaga sp. TaxID=1904254 RepID=UPI0035B0F67C